MPTASAAPPLVFLSALRSDVGVVRENNEDSAFAGPGFLALADGMGGHSSGEVASAIAVHTFAAQTFTDPESFRDAAGLTREILRRMSKADESLETMGTTMTALQHTGGAFYVCHIGDSRLYTLRGGALRQATTDHTHVQHLVETGRITREEVSTHPYRAMLLKSLDDQPGGSAPDLMPLDLEAGDRVLLCSDGLSDYVAEHVIAAALRLPDRDEAADALVAAALRAGTRDNVTVVVADVAPAEAGNRQFAGAANEPISVSPEAAAALTDADPDFSGPVAAIGAREDDPLTHTTALLQITHVASPAAKRARPRVTLPGVLAACAVIAVGVAIAVLL